MQPVRLLFWNIRHGGGPTRTPELILAALELSPDVLVLAEFHGGTHRGRGNTWHGPVVDAGLTHVTCTSPTGETARNGMFIASRLPLCVHEPSTARLLAVHLALHKEPGDGEQQAHKLALLAAHIPCEEAAGARIKHFRDAAAWAKLHASTPAVLMGDLNTSRRGLDLPREGQRNEALLGELWTAGLRDVWHEQGGNARQSSWLGPRGERHRIDTALASKALLRAGVTMKYVHEPENAKSLSDHAGILLELFTART